MSFIIMYLRAEKNELDYDCLKSFNIDGDVHHVCPVNISEI